MHFEWDAAKATRNEDKHGVTFDDATTVFGDPLAITFDDHECSENERRHLTFGLSLGNRVETGWKPGPGRGTYSAR
jgi:hypothetical protein